MEPSGLKMWRRQWFGLHIKCPSTPSNAICAVVQPQILILPPNLFSSRALESCSTDTYQLSGPCLNRICYLYLVRVGSDGWKPESVSIYGYYSGSVTFYYNTFLPYGQWYGFNYCNGHSMISTV